MLDLDSYFGIDKRERDSHPLIRLLDMHRGKPEFGAAKVQIIRPRAALGFEPAQLSLQFFDKQDQMYDYKTEFWGAELNDALVDLEIRAIDESNEIQRFGLGLAAALQQPENRYGDGYYSSVLMLVIDQSPFAKMDSLRELRPYISTNRPYEGGQAAENCTVMIQAALQDRWLELRKKFRYDKTDAERILAGALAYYLDERFGVTDGRKLGWLKAQ
ncbi:hypothetical protein BH23PLA1_BH23PLA1_30290 [soil metagenome]